MKTDRQKEETFDAGHRTARSSQRTHQAGHIMSTASSYKKLKKLGKGSFGSVYLVQPSAGGEALVMKEVSLRGLGRKERQALRHVAKQGPRGLGQSGAEQASPAPEDARGGT